MNLDTLTVRLKAAGLPKVDEMLACAKPGTHLKLAAPADPASTSSRIGGLPLLAPGVAWPRKEGKPLSIVAQIRLDPLEGATTVLGLPRTGALSFLYDVKGEPWGFDPADRGSFAVVYTEDPDACAATPFPDDLGEEGRIAAVALNAEPTVTLPSFRSADFPSDALAPDERDAWFDALEDLAAEQGWAERVLLGGHPYLIQGDMGVECEIVGRAGVSWGNGSAYRDPRLPEWKAAGREWVHLLQIGSAEDAGMMWGDLGCLYFWMRQDDIVAGRFDAVWTILQCD